jgi:prolyl 4-hydroxylase
LLTLSVAPVLFKVRGFLKEKECEEIINIGENRMEESPVSLMDKDKEKGAKEFRTSTQARISWAESDTLRRIDSRVAKLTKVPKTHNEEVQILRYKETQYYSAHLDNWDPTFYSDSAWFEYGHNNRFITVFWYLTDVDKGGETIFPRANGLPQPLDMWSCERGLKVKPERGAVIFWYSLHPNGNTDPNGLHGACPVVEGHKWSANYWVWNKPRVATKPYDDDDDTDSSKKNEKTKKDLLPKHFAVGAVVIALLLKRIGAAKQAKDRGAGQGEETGGKSTAAAQKVSAKKSRKEKKRQ